MTVEVNSTMTTRQSMAVAQIIPQYRYSEGIGRRRLLTPDEVLRLPNDQLLIVIRGQKVLRAKKFDYTGHPYAKECVRASIRDYPSIQGGAVATAEPVPEPPEAEQIPTSSELAPAPAPPPVPSPEPPKPAKRRSVLYESAKPPTDF